MNNKQQKLDNEQGFYEEESSRLEQNQQARQQVSSDDRQAKIEQEQDTARLRSERQSALEGKKQQGE